MKWSMPSLSSPMALSIPDRKSTRLNSSHDQISYAVFCLKKKKKHRKPEELTSEPHSRSHLRYHHLPAHHAHLPPHIQHTLASHARLHPRHLAHRPDIAQTPTIS